MRKLSAYFRSALLIVLIIALSLPRKANAAQDLEQGTVDLAQQLATALQGQTKKVAIVEFTDLSGFQSILGQFISEELLTQLTSGTNAGKFDVVERRLLARVLQEQQLTDSSLFDAASITKIGKILGIQVLITGSIADLGTEIKINARAISVESAKVFAAAAIKITKTETVRLMMNQSAGRPTLGSQDAGPRRLVQGSDVFFQNEFLRVDVAAISVTKDLKTARLVLTFANLLQENLVLGVEHNGFICWFSLSDEAGQTDNGDMKGLPCFNSRPQNTDDFAVLGPKAKIPVSFSFETDESWGKLFAFGGHFLRTQNGEIQKFTVGISGIEVRP
jgi:TolB-like protein